MNTINVKAGYKKEKVLLENLSSLIKLSKIAKKRFQNSTVAQLKNSVFGQIRYFIGTKH
jgi:hypothetical protein